MATSQERFGVDLHLLRDLDRRKSSRDPGNDLVVKERRETGRTDLDTLSNADNLVQALLLRLLPIKTVSMLEKYFRFAHYLRCKQERRSKLITTSNRGW